MAHTYIFTFSKTGDAVYISHLDLMRLLNRAARRAELPVSLTQGFNPHLKIKLKRALKLGIASSVEEGEVILNERIESDELLKKWQSQMPEGIEIRNVRLEEIGGDK